MGFFDLRYRDIPGRGIQAQGGLVFHSDEATLARSLAPILGRSTLSEIIGQAVFWVTVPNIAAIWVFPFALGAGVSIRSAIVASVVAFYYSSIVHRYIYNKTVNRALLFIGQRWLQAICYLAWAVNFWPTDQLRAGVLAGAFVVLGMFQLQTILDLPVEFILRRSGLALACADQVLRTVARHEARRLGVNLTYAAVAQTEHVTPVPATAAPQQESTIDARLRDLSDQRDRGEISQEVYGQQKRRILGLPPVQ